MMVVAGLAFCLAMVLVPMVASAASEAEKQQAIEDGLKYLASTQLINGSWSESNGYPQAATGSALLALQEHGFHAGDDVYGYGDVVGKGLDYLLNSASSYQLTKARSLADDHGGNNLGAYWGGGEAIYVSGIVTSALASAGAAQEGRLATGGAFNGKTLKSIVADSVDYFDQAQVTSAYGNYRGGWRYDAPGATTADNSTSQWPAIAMLFAQGNMGISVPQDIKNELKYWIDYIQVTTGTPGTGYYGGAGYDYPGVSPIYGIAPSESKTGGLLVEMAFVGYNSSNADVLAAIDFLNRNWQNGANGTWYGDFGHPYAMWSVYKGLETMIGLDVSDSEFITSLHADPGDIDNPNHDWNWWEDYCNWLVLNQNVNGSWNGYEYWGGALATGWYLNILLATVIPPDVPEPLTCGVLMLGLGGLFGYIRRRRLA
jgi:hypothetical protein